MACAKLFRMFRIGVLLAGFFVCLSSAQGQTWKQIGNLPPGTDLRCAYFWDTADGIVAGVHCIYTYNSGVWRTSSYPEEPDTIKSLRLLNGYNLYAASGATCIWESTDHGVTWQKTSALLPYADDFNVGEDGLIHGVNLKGTGMSIGTTISHFIPYNNAKCVAAMDDNIRIKFSGNGGVFWDTTFPLSFISGYSCAADTCNATCYILSDDTPTVLYRSMDYGKSWEPEYNFGKSTHDILEGADFGVLYVQGIDNVWRSTSGGMTWENIGGPGSNLDDRRMFTFGLYNRYLIDMDSAAVWIWDGGTGYVPTGPMPKILNVSNVVDTNCTFSTLTVNLALLDYPDTIRIHAYTQDSSTIQPTDTTIILPAGAGTVSVPFRTSVSPFQFNTAFYFQDTLSGKYSCGQYLYVENTFMTVQLPSYPQNILSVNNVTDTACSLSQLTINFLMTTNPDTVRIHAYTNDGLMIQPTDTTLIVPEGKGWFPVPYQASAHPFQFASTFYFEDTVSGAYKCGSYKYVTDSSILVNLYPPPGTPRSWLKTPLKFDACVPTRIPLVIRAPNICDSLTIDSITWSDTTLTPSLDHQPPETLGPDGLDTFWVTLFAPTPGIYNNFYYIHTTSIVLPRPWDTALYLYALASGSPTNPRASAPSKLTISNCAQASVPFYLHALTCDSVEFTGCTLSFSSSMQSSNNFNFPLDLAPETDDTLFITLPPQGYSGVNIVTADIKGRYLGSTVTFDTTVQIRVTFTNASSALVPNPDAVNLNTFSLCNKSESDTTIAFTNLGCDTMTVTGDQTVWENGWSASDPAFPFSLPPDDSFSIVFHYIPIGFTFTNQTVTYGFDYEGGKMGTVQLSLTGQATPASGGFSITDTAIDFGTFSQCGMPAADTTITVTNTGCDSLALSGASVDAGAGFTLTNGNDTTLAPNGSASFTIDFADSLTGAFNSAFHIIGIGTNGGNRIDTSVSLAATITPGTLLAAINTSAINFGTTSLCEERDSSVTITNKGCEPLTIAGNTFSSTQFGDTNSFPIVLLPDSSVTFFLFTQLDTTRHPDTINATLNFTLDSGASVPSVALTRSVIYPVQFSLSLAAQTSAAINATVPVYVLLHGTIPSQVDEVDFDLVYNDDLLSYNNAIQPDIVQNGPTTVLNGITNRPFKMSPASDRDTIATLQFQTYLTKNDSTSIQLTKQKFLSDGVISPSCIAAIDTISIPSHFILELGCDDSDIMAALNDSLPFIIESIQPNPAQDEITVELSGNVQPEIEMFDALGRGQDVRSTSLRPAITLNVSTMPSGVYYLRLSSGGYVQTRSISIER